MTSLDKFLDRKSSAASVPAAKTPHFHGEWNGNEGFISTPPMDEAPDTWDDVIREAGFDPEVVSVIEPVQTRFWDAAIGNGEVKRMRYYRLSLCQKRPVVDIDHLIDAARVHTATPSATSSVSQAFVVVTGDWQIGKMDGDGTEGTVARFIRFTEGVIADYERKAKGSPVVIIFTGDCLEGFVSQNGGNTWRTRETLTEQFRIVQRLMLELIRDVSAVAPDVTVISVPGNHDEANRPTLTYSDSWAVEALITVMQTLEAVNAECPGKYDHVRGIVPERDELTVTHTVANTTIAVAHGHQFGRGVDGWKKWWQGQQHGRQDAGMADLLIAGHKHHLQVITEGTNGDAPPRTFIQAPALESESTWYRHRAGAGGEPGMLTMVVSGGRYRSLEVIS